MLNGRYFIGAPLGAGAYGVVNRGSDLKNGGAPVAIKTIDLDELPADRRVYAAATLDKEMQLMKTLNHPNVLHALDLVVDGDRFHIVLELCEGPDLQVVLDARGALQMDEARDVTQQCLVSTVGSEPTPLCCSLLTSVSSNPNSRSPPSDTSTAEESFTTTSSQGM